MDKKDYWRPEDKSNKKIKWPEDQDETKILLASFLNKQA